MQVVAVINSLNRRELLIPAVESLARAFAAGNSETAMVVFDAGSTDGSREWLREFAAAHPELRLEILEAAVREQVPFSTGVNRGCQYALKTFPETEFLLLYETDNWVSGPEPLDAAVRLLRRQPKLAAAGFTVHLHSDPAQCGQGERFPTVFSFLLGPQLTFALGGIARVKPSTLETDGLVWFPADVVYTSPLLVRASVWRELGGMDETAFPFSDCDVEWTWRVARAGYGCGVLVTGAVVHDNLGAQSDWSSLRVIRFHQARFRLLRRYRGFVMTLAIPALFLRHLAECVVLAAMVLARRRTTFHLKKRLMLLKGVWSGYESLKT